MTNDMVASEASWGPSGRRRCATTRRRVAMPCARASSRWGARQLRQRSRYANLKSRVPKINPRARTGPPVFVSKNSVASAPMGMARRTAEPTTIQASAAPPWRALKQSASARAPTHASAIASASRRIVTSRRGPISSSTGTPYCRDVPSRPCSQFRATARAMFAAERSAVWRASNSVRTLPACCASISRASSK